MALRATDLDVKAMFLMAPVTDALEDYRSNLSEWRLEELEEYGLSRKYRPDRSGKNKVFLEEDIVEKENVNQDNLLSDIGIPVLIAHGKEDSKVPIEDLKQAVQKLDNAELIEVEDDHYLNESVQELCETSVEFFSEKNPNFRNINFQRKTISVKKKILIVGWGYPPKIDGGLDIAVKELFQGLKKGEIEADLMLPAERAPEEEDVIPVEVEGDMFSKAEQLSREAAEKASDYDIIHTHDWFGAEAGFKASKYADVKWVSSFHSLSSSRSRTPSEKLEQPEEIGLKKSDQAVAVSDKLAEEIDEKYGERPLTVYNGFSEVEDQENIDFDVDKPVFFYVGRHAEQKGLEHLLYGFKKYLEEDGGLLVLGGDGHLKTSLEDFVEILGIEEDVRFEGFIPDRELGGYYSAADAFVSPSINEPFGLTISEALNAGTPVVCTESGINELLPGEAVTLVEPDSDSIAEGLKKSLEKDSVSVEGRSWSEMVDEYMEIYSDLIQ